MVFADCKREQQPLGHSFKKEVNPALRCTGGFALRAVGLKSKPVCQIGFAWFFLKILF